MITHPRTWCQVTALLSVTLLSCGGAEEETTQVIRPVRYQPVFATGGERVRTFAGVARASMESDLSFKVSGTVTRLAVNVGDQVSVGERLAELDPQDYELQLQQAGAALNRAQAEARSARANYARIQALYEDGNASRNDLDQSRATAESAQAQVEASTRELDLARLRVDYTRLSAPVGGAIAEVRTEVNENVSPGQVVIVLTSGEKCEVQVGMPEVLIDQVREGSAVAVRFDAIQSETFPATITEVAVAVTGAATTFPVTILIDHADSRIRPGMAAEVEFNFSTRSGRERIVVAAAAVGEDRDGRFVFVLDPSGDGFGTVHRRTVEVGALTGSGLEIWSGLSDGELVVTAGVHRLVEGQKVRVLDNPGDL